MMKGDVSMKILKIEDRQCYFSCDGIEWIGIDHISKDQMLALVNLTVKESVEIDPFDIEKIANQVHQIIYKSISEKLLSLSLEKDKFKDESERLYLKEIEKYKLAD